MDLLVSTLNSEDDGRSFEETQRDQILAYKDAFDVPGRTPRAVAGRIVLPSVTPEDDDLFAEYIAWYAGRFDATGRPPNGFGVFSPTHHGSPEQVIASLHADVALQEATGLDIVLPANATHAMSRRILENVATSIAPRLGLDTRLTHVLTTSTSHATPGVAARRASAVSSTPPTRSARATYAAS